MYNYRQGQNWFGHKGCRRDTMWDARCVSNRHDKIKDQIGLQIEDKCGRFTRSL